MNDEEILETFEPKVFGVDEDTEGIMTITYGTEEYMVSGKTARRIFDQIEPVLKERFPQLAFVLVPFYFDFSLLNMKELLPSDREEGTDD